MKRCQQGLGMITAIIILVIMASLAAAMMTFGSTQQLTSAQDVMSVRAWQAAKAGNDWGLYMVLNAGTGWNGGVACTDSGTVGTPGTERTKTIDLTADLGFSVSVKCSATQFNEGECALTDVDPACVVYPLDPSRKIKTIILYTITSIGSNGAPVASPGYVERSRIVIAEK
jgi:MSHA biogenesis protein MshP